MTQVTLGDLAAAQVLTIGDGYRTKRSEHGRPGFRILRVADVMDGSVSLDGPDFVSERMRRQIGSKAATAGDVLLTTKGTVGRVAVMPATEEPVVYSPQLCYFRVHSQDVLDARYLSYWFRSNGFKHQASHRMNNTDMAAYINLADVRSLELMLPEIAEQRAIAEVLGALDDKIAANTRLVTTSDELAVTLTRQSLRGISELAKIADITMGSSPPGASYNDIGRGVLFHQGIRDFGTRFPSNRMWTDAPVRMAEPGDVLLSVRAPVGRVNVVLGSTCIGRGLAALRSKTGQPRSLFHVLRCATDQWAEFEAEGTVFGSINKKQLSSLSVRVPTEDDASRLEQDLDVVEARLEAALLENMSLERTRDQLLPLLMSGKVRVKDAEKVVEEVV